MCCARLPDAPQLDEALGALGGVATSEGEAEVVRARQRDCGRGPEDSSREALGGGQVLDGGSSLAELVA